MPDEYKLIDNYINSNDQQMQLGLNELFLKSSFYFLAMALGKEVFN